MNVADWIVMLSTLLGIVTYGIWKTRHVNSVKSYLLGDHDLPWWTIGLSVMATQASAITFLSTPGQGYQDGMQFAQFYFGLPIAMVILCIFVLPIYYRLKVYTAYEYLESRFGRPTRTFTAILFLISRGLAAGLTIYAPAIILSTILGWSLNYTILFIGLLVTIYTMAGGTKAVSVTQKHQMTVILGGMIIAGIILVLKLPSDISFGEAVGVAGKMGKLEVVNFSFDLSNRYTFWSGMLGGVFLFLSYFGTDQSQVSRYLSGKSLTESRLGLIFNGLLKVPMQFLILFIGVLVFLFFQFTPAPLHFNKGNVDKINTEETKDQYARLEAKQAEIFDLRQQEIRHLIALQQVGDKTDIEESKLKIQDFLKQDEELRNQAIKLILKENPKAKTKDTDYVFITFIIHYLPIGLVGLLLAVIFSAAMSSTSSELNALATTTVIDIYKRTLYTKGTDRHYLLTSKGLTIFWGIIAIIFALTADLFENLIQAVNIIGSLFYGTILGIFLIAFFFGHKDSKSTGLAIIIWAILGGAIGIALAGQQPLAALTGGILGAGTGYLLSQRAFKPIGGNAVFIGAVVTELIVLAIYFLKIIDISYLWLNLIGCSLVILISWFLEMVSKKQRI
jgi:solute:Na+ symporter, SSS family